MKIHGRRTAFLALAALVILTMPVLASSHREAPMITGMPKVDGTDFYVFNSYEAGREGYVTLIANYLSLQDIYGGPNYFSLDPEALTAMRPIAQFVSKSATNRRISLSPVSRICRIRNCPPSSRHGKRTSVLITG